MFPDLGLEKYASHMVSGHENKDIEGLQVVGDEVMFHRVSPPSLFFLFFSIRSWNVMRDKLCAGVNLTKKIHRFVQGTDFCHCYFFRLTLQENC